MSEDQTIIPPKDGWKEKALYLVEVSFNFNNPKHTSFFYTGFLHDGNPSLYHFLFNPGYENTFSISDVCYMKALDILAIEVSKFNYEKVK